MLRVRRTMRMRMKSCYRNEPNCAAASVSTTSADEKTSVSALIDAPATTERIDCASPGSLPTAHLGNTSSPVATATSHCRVMSARTIAPTKKSSGVAHIQKFRLQFPSAKIASGELPRLLMCGAPTEHPRHPVAHCASDRDRIWMELDRSLRGEAMWQSAEATPLP